MIPPESATLDRVFDILSDERRRRLLYFLSDSSDGTATVEELSGILGDDPRRIETRLRHVHVPRLEAAGIVEFDDRTETIRYHENQFLECVLENGLERDGSREG